MGWWPGGCGCCAASCTPKQGNGHNPDPNCPSQDWGGGGGEDRGHHSGLVPPPGWPCTTTPPPAPGLRDPCVTVGGSSQIFVVFAVLGTAPPGESPLMLAGMGGGGGAPMQESPLRGGGPSAHVPHPTLGESPRVGQQRQEGVTALVTFLHPGTQRRGKGLFPLPPVQPHPPWR